MSNTKKRQRIKSEEVWPKFLLKACDAMAIVLGLMVLITWSPEVNSKSTIVISLISIGIFSVVAELFGVYRNWRGIAFEREAVCTSIAWVIAFMLLGFIGRFSIYSTEISARALCYWMLVTPIISLSFRIFVRWIVRWKVERGINARKFAVVGVNDLGVQLVRNVSGSPDLGLKFLGFYDDRPKDRTIELPDEMNNHLGKLETLVNAANTGEVQVVFITLPMRAEQRIRDVIAALADTTASVYIVPDLFVFQMLNSRWTDIQGLPVVSVFENPFWGVDGVLKRCVDVAVASAALCLAAIPMLIIAAAVKLTSRGPALFKQKRYGLDGKQISVWKFRSMTVCENGDKVTQATKNDKRLTSIGGFLRRSSLDELPQIINVLSGQMSLVGPRPHANAHNEYYRKQIDGYMLRHKVKPGITGLAQVSGCRGETDTIDKMEKRIDYDHQYIREWSIWLDIRIMFQTLFVVLSRKGNAY